VRLPTDKLDEVVQVRVGLVAPVEDATLVVVPRARIHGDGPAQRRGGVVMEGLGESEWSFFHDSPLAIVSYWRAATVAISIVTAATALVSLPPGWYS